MGNKPFWQSKTFWANLVAVVAPAVPGAADVVGSLSPGETAALLGVVNLVLRLVTKQGVSLT